MKKAKYEIENSIAMRARFRHLVQQVDFSDKDVSQTLKSNICHIYMICSRPKITFIREKIEISKKKCKVGFMIHHNESRQIVEFEFDNKNGYDTFELNEARNRILLKNKDGKILTDGKSSLLYPSCLTQYEKDLDLKVLYIGQAFGKNGKRLASERLLSHNTLQKIYSEFMDKNPSEEIWLILWQFEPYYISMMGSFARNSTMGFKKSLDNYERLTNTTLPLDQQITITEAALIKYFSPEYNIEYKTNFPDSSHSSYEFCYRLDFNNVCFELDTCSIVTRLYSETIEPNFYHVKSYFLHSDTERKNMFNIEEITREQ